MTCTLLATAWWTLAQTPPPQGSDSSAQIIWAILLLGLAAALFFVEIFVPSAGLIGVASVVSAILGIVLLFRVDTTAGLIGATVTLLAVPFALAFAIKIAPHTPIIRMLTLKSDRPATGDSEEMDDEEDIAENTAQPTPPPVVPVPPVGAIGKTLTQLRPVGTCLINGRREECLAIGDTIEAGTPIEVVAADGMSIKVRPKAG